MGLSHGSCGVGQGVYWEGRNPAVAGKPPLICIASGVEEELCLSNCRQYRREQTCPKARLVSDSSKGGLNQPAMSLERGLGKTFM